MSFSDSPVHSSLCAALPASVPLAIAISVSWSSDYYNPNLFIRFQSVILRSRCPMAIFVINLPTAFMRDHSSIYKSLKLSPSRPWKCTVEKSTTSSRVPLRTSRYGSNPERTHGPVTQLHWPPSEHHTHADCIEFEA